MKITDEEIIAFRGRLTATAEQDQGREWSFFDAVPRLIDYCNRALGCGIYDGQVWRGAAGFQNSPDQYRRCEESRHIVASALATLRSLT